MRDMDEDLPKFIFGIICLIIAAMTIAVTVHEIRYTRAISECVRAGNLEAICMGYTEGLRR